ncbi:MAG: transposase [Candidatus Paracaedibacter sp.]
MKKQQAKIYEARRNVITLETVDWLSLIDAEHPARRIIRVLDQFDLTQLYEKITSEKSCQGRPAIDPKIMLAIMVYAAMMGITSSRAIASHCKWEPGFRWILGYGLIVGYVTISTFRKEAGKCLDNILTQVITAMVAVGVVDLEEVILDGTKIKANAGRRSFHTEEELEQLKKEISDKLAKVTIEEQKINHKSRLDNQEKRIQKALDQIPGIQKVLNESAKKRKKGTKAKEAKSSKTDPDARQMRFADGAKGPGYNAQFRTASKIGVIVEVQVIQRRNDSNMLTPMLDSFEFRYGYSPARILGDVNYCVKEDIEKVLRRGMEVYYPQTKSRESSTVREV